MHLVNIRKAAVVGASLLAIVVGAGAQAQTPSPTPSETKEFNIPAGDMAVALRSYIAQSGQELVYVEDQIQGKHAAAVSGTYSDDEALKMLLGETALVARRDPSGAVMLVAVKSVSSGGAQGAGVTQRQTAPAVETVKDKNKSDADEEAYNQSDDDKTDVVVVTGTRLEQYAPTAQVTIITREQMELRNLQTAEDALTLLLQNNSAVRSAAPGGDNTTGAGFNNFNQSASADLRGLGSGSTLMLLNGSPITASALAQGGANFADIAGLPSAAIQRIEVFNDSASAVYGTDAIGGVVNIITRTTYDGLQASVNFNGNGYGGDSLQASLFGGVSGDRWNILGSFAYQTSDATSYVDLGRTGRDYTALGGGDYRSDLAQPGRFHGLAGPLPGIGDTYATILPGSRSTLTFADLTPGATPDDYEDSQFIGESEVYSAFLHAGAELTDTMTFSLDALASTRKVDTDAGPETLNFALTDPAYAPFLTSAFPSSIYANYVYKFENETAAGLLPSKIRESKTDKIAINAKLTGAAPFASEWKWSLTGFYSSDKGHLDLFSYEDALKAAALAGTINVISDGLNADPAAFANLTLDDPRINNSKTSLLSFNGNLQGALFDLPGGAVTLLAGAEYREDRAAAVGTNVQGIGTNQDLVGTALRKTTSVYGELAVPVVGEDNAVPGFHSLLLTGAVRYAHSASVSDATVYRVGLAWEPVDGVKVTAAHGTSFRAPSVFDVSEPLSGNLIMTPDFGCPLILAGGPPCFGFAQNNFGGNDQLDPEKGKSWSIGAEIAPAVIPGLKFGAEVQDIDFTGRIVDPLGEFGLEFTTANTDLFPGVVVRDETGALLELNAIPINLAKTESRAYDVFASYRTETPIGRFFLSYDATYQAQLDETVLPDTAPLELAGTSYRGPYWRHRVSASFNPAALPGATFTVDVNHLPGYIHHIGARGRDTSTGGSGIQNVDSFTTVDLFVSYRLEKNGDPLSGGWRVSAGVGNLFDADTPFMDTLLGFDVLNGNPYGRRFSASLVKEF